MDGDDVTEPTKIIAGDTVTWLRDSGYDPATWTLRYVLISADRTIALDSVAEGSSHRITAAPADTAAWRPGVYRWVATVSDGTDRHTIDQGRLTVDPDPAGAEYDPRSTARVVLDMIDTYLRDPTNLAAASYSLAGRSLSRWSRTDLLVERDKWTQEARSEEAAEAIAKGLGNPRRLYVRWGRA